MSECVSKRIIQLYHKHLDIFLNVQSIFFNVLLVQMDGEMLLVEDDNLEEKLLEHDRLKKDNTTIMNL